MNGKLREMRIGDYEAMYDLWKRTPGVGLSEADSRPNIERFLSRNEGLNLVWEEQGAIVGTILCGHDGRRGYLYHLAVDERFRRLGIGRTLAAESLRRLRERGIGKCHLFVFADNEAGVRFWTLNGWKLRNDILICSHDL